MKNDETKGADVKAADKKPRSRMHSMELKGAGKPLPTTAGTHTVKADGKLERVAGSATQNPEPFADLPGIDAAAAEPTVKK